MSQLFRLSFALAYLLGLSFFIFLIAAFRARRPVIERRLGPLPSPPALISWLVPPILLLTGVGTFSAS